jgi:hypothetical protein
MSAAQAQGAYCNARRRRGGRCHLPAGWGTRHVGRGPCRKHLGNVPNVIRHHARAEAMEFVVGQLGAAVQIDSLEAAVRAVELANGVVEFWRVELWSAVQEQRDPTPTQIEGYRMALTDLARITKLASDAGVADRLAEITERTSEQLVIAAEQGITELARTGLTLTVEQRTMFARGYAEGLRRLEGQPIEGQAKQLNAHD